MNSVKLSKLTLQFLLLLCIGIIGYMAIMNRTESLINERYSNISKDMRQHLVTLIKEKEGTILQISLAMAENEKIRNALLTRDTSKIQLEEFSLKLRKETELKNIWFQIIDADGKSFYRSFSQKSGDDLSNVRSDVSKIIKNPHTLTTISVGKFALSLKSMVPIYDGTRFIGIFETISRFNSIALKMAQNKDKTIILVDKSYKNKLEHADKNKFIQNYFVANDAPDEKLLQQIAQKSVKSVISCKDEFSICSALNSIVNIYTLYDDLQKPMAHFIMAHDLNDVYLQDIYQIRNTLFIVFFGLLFGSAGIFLYYQSKRELIEELNYNLQEMVSIKTKELSHLAHHDPLTGLANRLFFLEIAELAIESAKRDASSISILFLDLDRFKDINDTHGHHTGDELLKIVAKRLKLCIRAEDTVSRLAGDEFTILLKNITDDTLVGIVEKIIDTVQKPIESNNNILYITFSVGISCFPRDGLDINTLMSNADTAMYKAKELGRNMYQFYDEKMSEYITQRLTLEKNLKIALQEGQFEPFYQPQIDAYHERIIGAEALVRWNSPELGIVLPNLFIPIAEQTSLIVKIDLWMMQKTMSQFMELHNEGINAGKLSLNISAKQLESRDIIENITTILHQTGFDAKNLELEITEREMMRDPETTIKVLNKFKELGINIAVDDFGTGHSSLSYIKRLPIDKLKIDKSFIDEVTHDKGDIAIVRSVIAIAKHLDMDIIAEGVETQEQKDFLVQEGCFKIQGYFYSKPLTLQEYKQFLLS